MPDWFIDHDDARKLGIPVTEIGSVSYRRRLEAREFHAAVVETKMKMAKRWKAQGMMAPEF